MESNSGKEVWADLSAAAPASSTAVTYECESNQSDESDGRKSKVERGKGDGLSGGAGRQAPPPLGPVISGLIGLIWPAAKDRRTAQAQCRRAARRACRRACSPANRRRLSSKIFRERKLFAFVVVYHTRAETMMTV